MIVIMLILGALMFAAGRWTPAKWKAKRRSGPRDDGTPPADAGEPQKALVAVAHQ